MDCDPNAVTDQVEAPEFTFEAPKFGLDAPRPSTVRASAAAAPTIEEAVIDRKDFAATAIGPTVIEIAAVAPPTLEPPTLEPPTVEVAAVEVAAVEAPAVESGPVDASAVQPATHEVAAAESSTHATAPTATEPATIEAAAPLESQPVPELAEEADCGLQLQPPPPVPDTPLELHTIHVSRAVELSRSPTEPTSGTPERGESKRAAASPAPAETDSGALEHLAAAVAAPLVSVEAPDPPPARVRAGPEPSTRESAQTDAPQIDRTRTIRALAQLELEDGQASSGFAIQLMLSEQEIDPREVPNLSIFAEYRLYAVTGLDQDRIMHALRLGFFSSEAAAAAVAGYLATFFDAPCIKRVSVAEHERFEERRVVARKDIGTMGGHDVIELAGPSPLPPRRTIELAGAAASSAGQSEAKPIANGKRKAPDTNSIWSRLIPMRKR